MLYNMAMRALIISAIVLVAVIMGMSAIAPAMAPPGQQLKNPVLAFSDGCRDTADDEVCVAVDRNRNNRCDTPPFVISTDAAAHAGVNGVCTQPT